MNIEILGIPFNGLGSPPDIENPAEGLRQANIVPLLESKGHTVTDHGDILGYQFQNIVDTAAGIKDFDLWLDLSESLASKLGEISDQGGIPLLLGGDCSMLVGIFLEFAQSGKEVGLIFLDGHADYHTLETSPSGDPADMELAVLTGRGHPGITGISGKIPLLREEDVVVYGIRAWDQIAESKIQVFSKTRMAEIGIKAAVAEGMELLAHKRLPIWLHFDVDVIDPEFMPVMFPEPEGLTFEETREILSLVWDSGLVIGLSIACYHPRLDIDGSAGAQLVSLISEVLSGHTGPGK